MTPLQQCIVERIQREGPISFADYMRMVLYEPGYGYYVTGQAKMGWEGDYYTSADVADFFANSMGCQLQRMWEKLGKPDPFIVLEQGAGRGDLASGVRAWAAQQAPDFNVALDYRTEDIRMGVDVISDTPMPGHPQMSGRPQGDPPTIYDAADGVYGTGGPLRAPWRGVDATSPSDATVPWHEVDTAAF